MRKYFVVKFLNLKTWLFVNLKLIYFDSIDKPLVKYVANGSSEPASRIYLSTLKLTNGPYHTRKPFLLMLTTPILNFLTKS